AKKINGKTLKEISEEKKCAYTTLQQLFARTKDEELIASYTLNKSSIEQIVEGILKKHTIEHIFNKQLNNSKLRPDFLIPSHNLIIECDGLYWHNEASGKNKNYHKNKKDSYKALSYKSLFFREDEILNKPGIVESIILNKLGKSA